MESEIYVDLEFLRPAPADTAGPDTSKVNARSTAFLRTRTSSVRTVVRA
jgi:hypothetical protein